MKTTHTTLAALCLASAALADTLTVGPPGSGADFEEIGDAVTAAAPGDSICVQAGQYQDFGTIVVDKPLSILGAGSDDTSYAALPTGPFDVPLPFLITGLEQGAEVRLVGISLESRLFGASSFGPSIAVLTDCAGPVVLADVAGTGSAASGGIALVLIDNCAQVALDGCSLVGTPVGGSSGAIGGVHATDSGVHVNACSIQAASGSNLGEGAVPPDGGVGVTGVNSVVRISASQVWGGIGGTSGPIFAVPTQVGDGGPAVASSGGGKLLIRGGPFNQLIGGNGPSGVSGGGPIAGAGAPGVRADATVLLTTTSDVVALAGADGGVAVAPPIEAGGAWTQVPERLAGITLGENTLSPGGTAVISYLGEPGAICVPAFSFGQGPSLAIPGVAGLALVSLGGYATLPPTTIGSEGFSSFLVQTPDAAALVGSSLVIQGLTAGPGGTLSLSAPTFLAFVQ